MKALRRLEDSLSGLLEQGFARLTRSALQPVAIARRLEQAMADGLVIESGRTLAPNQYWVFLHPQDYQVWRPLTTTLETDLREHLTRHAAAQGWCLLASPHVRLNPGQEVRRHAVRVIAQLAPAEPPAATITETQPVAPVAATRGQQAADASAELRTPDGAVIYPLARATVDVGRGRDNDVILDDPRVSRHHAQLRQRRGRYVIFDLDSANGTFINGRPIQEAVLTSGDRVSFGGVELVFGRGET